MRSLQRVLCSLTAGLVLLCGCDHNGIRTPSALSYATSTAVYTKGMAITPNGPTSSGGTIAAYSVNPSLPAGLVLNSSLGIVSGTPTAITATGSYIVTAINSAGNTTATLSITVNDQAPRALGYATGAAIYPEGAQIAPNVPISSGGAVISYSVNPTLPSGLSLSSVTGIISGAPTVVAPAASYTVTAINSGGSATTILNITVMAPAPSAQQLPNVGQQITPLAPYDSTFEPLVPKLAQYPSWQAGHAVSSATSPDGKTLLILTSGFNRLYNPLGAPNSGLNADYSAYDYANSEEYVFVFDISQGTPVQKQVVPIPNTYSGLTFDPSGKGFYVSGGMGDYPFANVSLNVPIPGALAPSAPGATFTGSGDNVHVFALGSDNITWVEQEELVLNHPLGLGLEAALDHSQTAVNDIVAVQPMAAGVAISSDGLTFVVANYYNDSLTMFTGGLGNWQRVTPDIDLRPGDGTSTTFGTPGGEYPFWVVIQGTGANATAFVSSMRDREVDVVSLGSSPQVTGRVPVKGEPIKMTMNGTQSRLYVAEDMSDTVDVIDISKGNATNGASAVLETIPVVAPAAMLQMYPQLQSLTGANSNSVTLSPDGTQLYVTNGNLNAVAVVQLTGMDKGDQIVGLIPTGWYPNAISFGSTKNSPNGNWVYVVNGKSPTGANPGWCYSSAPPLGSQLPGAHKNCTTQQYNPQLVKAGFQSFPQPTGAQLATLTAQVAINNRFANTESASDLAIMAAVRQGIQHVIFIIKENRGYDQVLGDLEVGNGDPALTEFGRAMTPNLHKLASSFVTLDNFMASAETSTDGWPWTVSARSPDLIEKEYPIVYAGRGLSLTSEGENRNVNVAIQTLAARIAANPLTPADGNVLPGTANPAAPDGPDSSLDKGKGYLWDAALRAGLTVRSYGFFVDTELYPCAPPPPAPQPPAPCIPLDPTPFAHGIVMGHSTSVSLTPFTDPYYRGFDNQYPDYYRFQEWAREFDTNYAAGGLPNLSLVRLMHDHTGNFNDPGEFGINTPELQQTDNDYAVGLLIQKIYRSIYAQNTLIFVVEDDSQDSGDHVDSHRTVALVAGAYVKQQALVSTPYNTINFLRTIEEVLGVPPMNLNDAVAKPMTDIFNTMPSTWSFTAAPSAYLYCTKLASQLPTPAQACPPTTQSAAYWAHATRKMNFTNEDDFDFALYNRVLWKGLMGNRPYPSRPNGKDLRNNRGQLLARFQGTSQHKTVPAAKPIKD